MKYQCYWGKGYVNPNLPPPAPPRPEEVNISALSKQEKARLWLRLQEQRPETARWIKSLGFDPVYQQLQEAFGAQPTAIFLRKDIVEELLANEVV
ncbi:MAG: hypothetical protein HUJ30_00285 [Gammaproteobacteria bacterium]|nr:hypothetical protein [Gammaproteobacteria bacterium]